MVKETATQRISDLGQTLFSTNSEGRLQMINDSPPVSFHALVRGRVQGVFFRAFVHGKASKLGLKGYVRNITPSGEVEVVAEGERGKLEELIQSLHKGPPASRVDEVEVIWGDYSGGFSEFSIRH